MRPRRLFTLEEANALVPKLTLLMQRLQHSALRLDDEVRACAEALGEPRERIATERLVRERPAARALVAELDAVGRELEDLEVELKDVRLGLVDFPSDVGGDVVYLCWQFGEPEVSFWHRTSDGFAGRRPLPGTSAERLLQ